MVRILCIGNQFYYPDDFGMQIYFELSKRELHGIELVEGGVGGMSLLPYFEDEVPLLIVDFATYEKKILTKQDIDMILLEKFDHADAFLYLLKSVKKDFVIFTCTQRYEQKDIPKYADEVLSLAKEIV